MRLPKIFQPRGKKNKKLSFQAETKFLSKKGFTLIEVVIGMAIIAFLAGLGLFLSMDFYRGYSFNYEKNLIVASLQKARSRAMANINQTPHGVYFDNGNHQYVVFQGDSFNPSDPKNEIFSANRTITLNDAPVTGVVFKQLSGDLETAADMTLEGEGKEAPISINEEGAIIW